MYERIGYDFPHRPVNERIIIPRHVVRCDPERHLDSGANRLRDLEEEVDDISAPSARTEIMTHPASAFRLSVALTLAYFIVMLHNDHSASTQ